MAAYLIVHRYEITDPQGLKRYSQGINDTIAKFGGRVAVRADKFKVFEGNWHTGHEADAEQPERITVLEFPDMAKLEAWYNSPEYAELKAIRQRSSKSDVAAVDGR